jgi:hypothetical protein
MLTTSWYGRFATGVAYSGTAGRKFQIKKSKKINAFELL